MTAINEPTPETRALAYAMESMSHKERCELIELERLKSARYALQNLWGEPLEDQIKERIADIDTRIQAIERSKG